MQPTLDHVTLVVAELGRSLTFFDAALAPLGLHRSAEFGDEEEGDADIEAAGWAVPGHRALLWVIVGETPTTHAHVSLRTASTAQVSQFYAAAIAAGGAGRNAPRRWPILLRGDFNAVVADPDGNLIEVVAQE